MAESGLWSYCFYWHGRSFFPFWLIDQPRTSYFDYVKYEKAYEQSAVGRSEEIKSLSKDYNDIISNAKKEKSQLYQKYSSLYSDSKNKNIKFKVVDETGFYKETMDLNRFISIVPNIIESPDLMPPIVTASPENFSSEFHKLKADLELANNEYESRLKESIQQYPVKFPYGKEFVIDNYAVEIEGLSALPLEAKEANFLVRLKSRSFKDVYPTFFNQDDNISVQFDGKYLKIVNMTNKFLEIKSISLYYNDKISSMLLKDNSIELPPYAYKEKIELVKSKELQNESIYKDMTLGNAKKISLDFGCAVKYRVVEQNIDKTLYETKAYRLDGLLINL